MVRGDEGMPGIWGPGNILLQNLVARATTPKFLGKAHDWSQLRKDWDRFVGLLDGSGQAIPDPILTQILQGCLDGTTQNFMEALRISQPEITMRQLWNALEKEVGVDTSEHARKE